LLGGEALTGGAAPTGGAALAEGEAPFAGAVLADAEPPLLGVLGTAASAFTVPSAPCFTMYSAGACESSRGVL
jgi:hypothetical protein